jgi:enamine deaminase RidA (YjgF/YER057c/UK114 family)
MTAFTPVIPPALQGVYDAWHFAPAVVHNGLIHCSGMIGTSPDGEPIAGNDFAGARRTLETEGAALAAVVAIRDPAAQFAAAFEGIAAVLAHAGASLADVIEMTTYHVDIHTHMATFMAVKDRYIVAPYPAWTAVGVSDLAIPGGLLELKVIAAAP